jgi:hypothetical protein
MGSQDSFFEALGPTSSPNDSPGFFTNATGLWRGVDVTGKSLGVRGRGSDAGSVGVEGHGGPGGNGVFGQGMNGIVGLSAAAVRNPDTESSNPAGVFGVGDGGHAAGVRGEALGPNAGVFGISHSLNGVTGPGVQGQSKNGNGVLAIGDTGVVAQGTKGPGLQASSQQSQAGTFESESRAQIRLVPSSQTDPSQFPQSDLGDLAVTFTDVPAFPSLWFCIVAGGPGQSQWKKIA